MNKILSVIFMLGFAGMLLAESAFPVFANPWKKTGNGEFKIEENSFAVAHKGGKGIAGMTCRVNVKPDSFYLVKGKIKRSADAKAAVYCIVRTAKNGWIYQFNAAGIKQSEADKWCDFEIRACLPASAAVADLTCGTYAGNAEFKDIVFEKSSWDNRNEKAGNMEYWINMDYCDEIVYAHNIGITGDDLYDENDIIKFFEDCKRNGVTGVQWRVSLFGHMLYHSKGAATVYPGSMDVSKLNESGIKVAKVIQKIDPLAIAVREARKHGIEIYIWMTLSDEGYKRLVPNYCTPEFLIKNPQYHMLDRNGKPWLGTICYSEPEAREYRLNIVKELLEYGADGLYLCTRSHCSIFEHDSKSLYGFNKTVVEEYKKRYGVDILTQDFDVKKFQEIKAEGIDLLIKEISKLAKAKNQKIRLGVSIVSLSQNSWKNNWGEVPLHWQMYLEKGWVDSIVSGQYNVNAHFASREYNRFAEVAGAGNKFYSWAQMVQYGAGVYTYEQLREQAKIFNFLGINGGIYHEAINMEERPDTIFAPLGKFYSKPE